MACFSYAHVPWVRPEQNKVDTSIMLEGYEKFRLFQLTVDMFTAADYCWIGIDHFAQRDDELSVALREKVAAPQLHGLRDQARPPHAGLRHERDRRRLRPLRPERRRPGRLVPRRSTREPLPVVKGHRLTWDDRLRRLTILNLMCNLELPWSLTEAEFGAPADELLAESLQALPPLIQDGLAEVDDKGLRITDKGRYFVRNVAMIMDAYLGKGQGRPIFSRTV